MLITIVAGARPNFIKISHIINAIKSAKNENFDINYRLVHTGQHFDKSMSGDFFDQLGIPVPDTNLQCGGGTQAQQAAMIMVEFEKELSQFKPNMVLVVGDVTSTMACAITAKKMGIRTVHVEAGIRSGDMTMPEEINRIITDAISDAYFTTSLIANNNLRALSIPEHKIHFVGNTMIDTLVQQISYLKEPCFWNSLNLKSNEYLLLTLHRPSNVDDPIKLKSLLTTIANLASGIKVVFPIHPRTSNVLSQLNLAFENIEFVSPQPYLEFIYLIKNARGVITDSGGITEEATYLKVPCITLRNSTERPETVLYGTNELVGDDPEKLEKYISLMKAGTWKESSCPILWDGQTAKRIVNVLLTEYA